MKTITKDQIDIFRKLLDYNPTTGLFLWKPRPAFLFSARGRDGIGEAYRNSTADRWNKRWAGKPAFFTDNKKGHLYGAIFARIYSAHTMAWALHHGEWPNLIVDHINGDGHDNRIANLRLATHRQSTNNVRAHGASPYKGAAFHVRNKRWISSIRVDGRRIHLGYFDTDAEAGAAYAAAADKYQGVFSLNASRGLGSSAIPAKR